MMLKTIIKFYARLCAYTCVYFEQIKMVLAEFTFIACNRAELHNFAIHTVMAATKATITKTLNNSRMNMYCKKKELCVHVCV